ncbi:MAG: signal peptidase I, partial [Verrucomicrobiota bacterium]
SPESLEKIEARRHDFAAALKARDAEKTKALAEELTELCEGAGSDYRNSALAENIEVIFVAIAIALGIRAYIAQPFKIPTGSMQPTLNGIVSHPTETPPPNPIVRVVDFLRLGRAWENEIAKEDETIKGFKEYTKAKFFTWTDVIMESGRIYTVFAPRKNVEVAYGQSPDGTFGLYRGKFIAKGDPIARGHIDTGDQVIVDKMSYHFLGPRRGEVFVFTTKNIRGISVDPNMGSIHYIKRLAGVPNDHILVKEPNLYVNGELAKEHGFRKVMSKENGYKGYQNDRFGDPWDRQVPEDRYVALGDNSFNSFDSRGWNYVPEENLVGRAFVVYWPFNNHWGLIR